MSENLLIRHDISSQTIEQNDQDTFSPEVQTEFFRRALAESADLKQRNISKQGPYYNDFTEVMREFKEMVQKVHPAYTPEHAMPLMYKSEEVKKEVLEADRELQNALDAVGKERLRLTGEVAKSIQDTLSHQTIATNVLDVPPYCYQREEWKDEYASRACSNACFRMVFGAITGWVPSEKIIGEQLIERYKTAIVDDSVYAGIYDSEVFKAICDRRILQCEIIGADFATIETLASRLKIKQPETQVYCVVNLASNGAGDRNVWHASVLLEASEDKVITHDPSGIAGKKFFEQTYEAFITRWAATYNRTQLIISAPSAKTAPAQAV